jgi:hypothetical protein
MGKYLKLSLIALLMLTLASAPALAQVTLRSTILGTVTDVQKAVVPAAEVQLKNLDPAEPGRPKPDRLESMCSPIYLPAGTKWK